MRTFFPTRVRYLPVSITALVGAPFLVLAQSTGACIAIVRVSGIIEIFGIAFIALALGTFARIAYLLLLFHGDPKTHLHVGKQTVYALLELLASALLFTIVRSCA